MKKISLVIILMFFCIASIKAQGDISFGVTGGYINGSGNASIGGVDVAKASDGSGFYIGLLADIGVSEKLSIQPEVLYGGIDGDGALLIPIMAKYYIADKFNLQAGPQFDVLMGLNELEKQLLKTTGFGVGFGAGFDINDNFAVQARYTLGLSNRIDGDITDILGEIADIPVIGSLISPELKINTFQVGLVYNFQ